MSPDLISRSMPFRGTARVNRAPGLRAWFRWLWALGLSGVALAGEGLGRRDPVEGHTVAWHGLEHGLPGGGATTMVQDPQGYLWFGTFQGLARFDGIRFQNHTPSNTPELPSSSIVNSHRDRSGTLWFSTFGGLASLEGGRWRRHGKEQGWTTDYARTFTEAPDGTLYVTGFDGKVLRRRPGGPFDELPGTPEPGKGGFGHCDPEGRLLLAKVSFVGFWDGNGWRPVPGASQLSYKTYEMVAGPARDGGLWIVDPDQVTKVTATGLVQRLRFNRPAGALWAVHEDASGDLWLSARQQGVFFVQLPKPGSDADAGAGVADVRAIDHWGGRAFRATRFVSEDDEGNVWLGTPGDGLARLRPKAVRTVGEPEGLGPYHCRSASVDTQGRLWVTSQEKGVFRCDAPERGAPFQLVNHDPEIFEAILADRAGRVWATGMGPGQPVFRLEDGTAHVVHRQGDAVGSRGGMFEDSRGRVWFAGRSDLLCHDQERWIRLEVPGVSGFGQPIGGGGLLACNSAGLMEEARDGAFVPVHDAQGRPVRDIGCIAPSTDGGMWLGTVGRGVALLGRDRSMRWIGVGEGMPMDTVTLVHEDAFGWLWVGGDRGIARVSAEAARRVAAGQLRRVHARLFDSGDGLPANGHVVFARQPKLAATADGRLWFPTTLGLAWLWASRAEQNIRAPRVLPTMASFVDDGGRQHEVPWREDGELRFPPGARSIRIGFSALNYAAPSQVLASTRLERGGEVLAEQHGPERSASYELLPPGRYACHVTAANEDGVGNDVGVRARFVMEPFLWQTGWFRWAMASMGAAGVLGVAGYWVRHARLASKLAIAERDRLAALESAEKAEALRQSEVRREKAEAEAEWRRQREALLRDVHDGVGGLVANMHLATSLALDAPDAADQRAQIASLEGIAHEALGEVRSLMDALEAQVADVRGLAAEFERYGNLVLGPHGIRLHVPIPVDDGPATGCGLLFLGLFRIVKEALANVVKHSRASSVEIRIVASPNALLLSIEDDGCGLPAQHRKGRGLSNMRQRAAELGGKMSLDSGHGLRLHLAIPWPGGTASGSETPTGTGAPVSPGSPTDSPS